MFHQEESCLSCSMARLLPITDRKENGKQANTAGTTLTPSTTTKTTKTTKTNQILAKLKSSNLTKTTKTTTKTSSPLIQTSSSASCEDIMDGYFCETAFQDEYCNEMFYWNGRNIALEWCKRFCNNCF